MKNLRAFGFNIFWTFLLEQNLLITLVKNSWKSEGFINIRLGKSFFNFLLEFNELLLDSLIDISWSLQWTTCIHDVVAIRAPSFQREGVPFVMPSLICLYLLGWLVVVKLLCRLLIWLPARQLGLLNWFFHLVSCIIERLDHEMVSLAAKLHLRLRRHKLRVTLVGVKHEPFASPRSWLAVSSCQTVIHVFLEVGENLTWWFLSALLLLFGSWLMVIWLLLHELVENLRWAIRVKHSIL